MATQTPTTPSQTNEIALWAEKRMPHSILEELGHWRLEVTPSLKLKESHNLLVIDSRQINPTDINQNNSTIRQALQSGMPVLLLEPTIEHLKDLDWIPAIPQEACQALLFFMNKPTNGELYFHLEGLATSELNKTSAGESFARDHFINTLTKSLEKKLNAPATQNNPPTGVKYLKQVVNYNYPFTYNHNHSSNKPGNLSVRYTLWGILEQTATGNSQFLIIEANHTLNPGVLHSNDNQDRGFATTFFKSAVTPQFSPIMNNYSYAPSGSMCNNFAGAIDVPISYESPTGGFQIWNFQSSFNNSGKDWCIQPAHSANTLGSTWFMDSPLKGTDISNWKSAFNFWGHVDPLPSPSTATLDVDSLSVWHRNADSNSVLIVGDYTWQGLRLFGSNCLPGICNSLNKATSNQIYRIILNFNFSQLLN